MPLRNMHDTIRFLEKHGELLRIKDEVDPVLEMASIHRKIHQSGGPAILFEHVKHTRFPCMSNIYGTAERVKLLFGDHWDDTLALMQAYSNPLSIVQKPALLAKARLIRPKQSRLSASLFRESLLSDLPHIKCWPKDGGAFITLPQVYSEDPDSPGWKSSNLGMYRIQISGNDYENNEVGLHYQIHRGIAAHHKHAIRKGIPLKVSIFIGGPPAHAFAAVMPLPENMSELQVAGLLSGRRFHYAIYDGWTVSLDADFVLLGEIISKRLKEEGPFGDHLGYYSLKHPFPFLKIHRVLHRKDAVWPFTVVGRPPQEDSTFGALIHQMSKGAVKKEIPGLNALNAVDAAGVHPLLLASAKDRYTPFSPLLAPQELLTTANRMLGTGQLSLAKYLFIGTQNEATVSDPCAFILWMLERLDWQRDLHFLTNTTIDTLDYSGTALNRGSKLILAAIDKPLRKLGEVLPEELNEWPSAWSSKMIKPGIMAVSVGAFTDYPSAKNEMDQLASELEQLKSPEHVALVVVCDDPLYLLENDDNFLWVTFTRSNPAHDVYGVGAFVAHKHWGCMGPLIIDARVKGHHAPVLNEDESVDKTASERVKKYGF